MNTSPLPTSSTPEARLVELGLELPSGVPSLGRYVGAVQSGCLLFCSGHLPDFAADPVFLGKLGVDFTVAQGYEAARRTAINLLGTVRASLGSLDRVARVVKVFGMVNSADEFTEQPKVIDGASDLLSEVFGERAPHARSAVGMAQLPHGNCVEIEAVFEVAPE